MVNRTEPAPSSTVVLARDATDSPEIFLVRRREKSAFGASHVFPGGLIEDQDRHAYCDSQLTEQMACRCLGLSTGALDYYSAAIRELFEETGVLLVRDARGRMPPAAEVPTADELAAARSRMLARELRWPDFLERFDLTLATDALTYFAFWITPEARRRRFSTRFFLAIMPDRQMARHDGSELTDSCWMTAAAALESAVRGELQLPPPTRATLRDLAALPSASELRTWAEQRQRAGGPGILPVILSRDGTETIVMPADRDHAQLAGRNIE
jgi:8-oxo-dGTP pyrophosphatase MutT (NUDIX family)